MGGVVGEECYVIAGNGMLTLIRAGRQGELMNIEALRINLILYRQEELFQHVQKKTIVRPQLPEISDPRLERLRRDPRLVR